MEKKFELRTDSTGKKYIRIIRDIEEVVEEKKINKADLEEKAKKLGLKLSKKITLPQLNELIKEEEFQADKKKKAKK